jgi:hypothetical protein
MSTTIHYFGKIKSTEAIREIQDEFYEIAQVSGWTHEVVDHVFTQEGDLQGNRLTLQGVRIVLNRQTTPLQLTFDKDGYLSHIYYEKAPVEMGDLMTKNAAPGRNAPAITPNSYQHDGSLSGSSKPQNWLNFWIT